MAPAGFAATVHDVWTRGALIVGVFAVVAGASMLPGLRLSQLAHELGHAATAVAAGYDVTGILLDEGGSAGTYTSLDPLIPHGTRDHVVGPVVLTFGIAGAAAFAGGMLLAARAMRTGRIVVLSVAAALVLVAFYCVPDDAELQRYGIGSPGAGAYTRTYSMAVAVALVIAALPGGAVTRATTYVLALVASIGLAGDVRELWWPSQYPTDAHRAASLTSVPIVVWRGAWTIGVVLTMAGPLLRLARSPNGWPLRRLASVGLGSPTPASRTVQRSTWGSAASRHRASPGTRI